jgi:hypothetical protein
MQRKERLFGIVVGILGLTVAGCASIDPTFKASGYYDTRELPTATVTVTNVDAKHRNRIFAYADLETESKFPKYTEATFTQQIAAGFGGIVEYNRNFNAPSGLHRFGVTYQPQLRGRFKAHRIVFKWTPFSTHDHGHQLSVTGAMPFGSDIVVDGYFDYNPNDDYVATDWQIGRRIKGDVYAVAEYRHNGTRRDATGVGIGVEWRIIK